MSFLVMGSSKVRPIRRLIAKNVRDGLVTACRLAGWPTRRSPSSVKATMDGVVRAPSAFSMTFGVLPSITATQEFVVPRSMPMTLPMTFSSHVSAGRPGPFGAWTETVRGAIRASLFADPQQSFAPLIAARHGSYRRAQIRCKTAHSRILQWRQDAEAANRVNGCAPDLPAAAGRPEAATG